MSSLVRVQINVFFVLCCVSCVSNSRYLIKSFNCFPSITEVCIEIRKCPFFIELLDRNSIPRSKTVVDLIKSRHCGFRKATPMVCCNLLPETTTTTTTSTTTTPTTTRTRRTTKKRTTKTTKILPQIDDDQNLMAHENFHLLPNDICGGISNDARITSGSKTGLMEFPWMALIAYYTSDGIDFRCGGTVINQRYILTAAHCIINSTIVGVRLGESNLITSKDCDEESKECAPPVQDFLIESVTVHPNYEYKSLKNDIALIRLATSANFTNENVKPICLPFGENAERDLEKKFVIVTGWGVTETGHASSELLKISIPVIPTEDCQKLYQKYADVTSDQLCAGGHMGRDSCGGDSGGPLKYVGLIGGIPRYVQYGIVSYGPRHCGADGQPGIYTKVTNYMTWILDNLKPDVTGPKKRS